jgi:hypothetical protein
VSNAIFQHLPNPGLLSTFAQPQAYFRISIKYYRCRAFYTENLSSCIWLLEAAVSCPQERHRNSMGIHQNWGKQKCIENYSGKSSGETVTWNLVWKQEDNVWFILWECVVKERKSKILNELFITKTEGHILLEYAINLRSALTKERN